MIAISGHLGLDNWTVCLASLVILVDPKAYKVTSQDASIKPKSIASVSYFFLFVL